MPTLNGGHARKYLRWRGIRGLSLNIEFDAAGGLKFQGSIKFRVYSKYQTI